MNTILSTNYNVLNNVVNILSTNNKQIIQISGALSSFVTKLQFTEEIGTTQIKSDYLNLLSAINIKLDSIIVDQNLIDDLYLLGLSGNITD